MTSGNGTMVPLFVTRERVRAQSQHVVLTFPASGHKMLDLVPVNLLNTR
jgi:hypothetical protein